MHSRPPEHLTSPVTTTVAATAAIVVAIAVTTGGCIVTSSTAVKRGRVWAQAGDAPVFVWMERERTTTYRGLTPEKDDIKWEKRSRTRTDRTWVIRVDPVTGRSTQLGWTSATAEPFYYDARRAVLWVQDPEDRSVIGLTPSGVTWPPGRWATFRTSKALPPPFMVADGRRQTRLYNATTNTELELEPGALDGEAIVDGDLLRIARVRLVDDRLEVHQALIDWRGGGPTRLPDLDWRSDPLAPPAGVRFAYALSTDGRQLLELIRADGARKLVAYDFGATAPPVVIPLPEPAHAETPGPEAAPAKGGQPPAEAQPELIALDRDRFVVFEPKRDGDCRRGYVVTLSKALVAPLPESACVLGVQRLPGATHPWLALRGAERFGYIDAAGALVDLGEHVRDALAIGGPVIAFARAAQAGKAIVRLDLATGTLTELATSAAGHKLLNMHGDTVVVLEDGQIVARRAGDPARGTPLPLPSRVGRHPEGMPRAYEVAGIGVRPERTKLWLGTSFGTSTKSPVAIDAWVQLRRWSTRRTSYSLGGFMRAEYEGGDTPPTRIDAGAAFGWRRYKDAKLGGWFVGAELGAGRSQRRADGMVTDTSFAASAALQLGWQGRLFGLQAGAIAPSIFDRDRGFMFVGGISLGLFGGDG